MSTRLVYLHLNISISLLATMFVSYGNAYHILYSFLCIINSSLWGFCFEVDIMAQLIFFHSRLNICGYNIYWLVLL